VVGCCEHRRPNEPLSSVKDRELSKFEGAEQFFCLKVNVYCAACNVIP
jgi:hypothetical protein